MEKIKTDVDSSDPKPSEGVFIPEVYFFESKPEELVTKRRSAFCEHDKGSSDESSDWDEDDSHSDPELSNSDLEAGQDGSVLGEGFIPVYDLSADDLPWEIRSEKNYKHIKDIADRVVCIINNKISEDRPEQFKFAGKRSMKGTGFVLGADDEYAIVSTNRHVLYNNEEIRQATLYLDFDQPLCIDGERNYRVEVVKRGRGLGALRGNVSEDFTLAMFSLDDDLIIDSDDLPVLMVRTRAKTISIPETARKTVCVISHPKGQPKQVSFGHVLQESWDTGEFLHDATTLPGSSGAPIIIFSPDPPEIPRNSIWYHISKNRVTGVNSARLQVNDAALFDINMDFAGSNDLLSLSHETRLTVEEKVFRSMNYLRLFSYWTFLGRVVLQPQRFSTRLRGNSLKPCNISPFFFLERYKFDMDILKALLTLSKKYRKMTTHSLLTLRGLHPVPKIEDITDIFRTLKHIIMNAGYDKEGALGLGTFPNTLQMDDVCFCGSLLKLAPLESRSKDEPNSIHEGPAYLSPDSDPCNLSRHPTWPFGPQQFCENAVCSVGNQCLLRRFYKGFGMRTLIDINISSSSDDVSLTSLDVKARAGFKETLGTAMICDVIKNLFSDFTKPFLHQNYAKTLFPGGALHSAPREIVRHLFLEERTHESLELILDFLEKFMKELDIDSALLIVLGNNFFRRLGSNPTPQTGGERCDSAGAEQTETEIVLDSDEEIIYERVPHPHTTKKRAQLVAQIRTIVNERHQLACGDLKSLVSHAMQHYRQDHKDGVDHKENRCECGRPSLQRLIRTLKHLRSLHLQGAPQPETTQPSRNKGGNTKRKRGKESMTQGSSGNSKASIRTPESENPSCLAQKDSTHDEYIYVRDKKVTKKFPSDKTPWFGAENADKHNETAGSLEKDDSETSDETGTTDSSDTDTPDLYHSRKTRKKVNPRRFLFSDLGEIQSFLAEAAFRGSQTARILEDDNLSSDYPSSSDNPSSSDYPSLSDYPSSSDESDTFEFSEFSHADFYSIEEVQKKLDLEKFQWRKFFSQSDYAFLFYCQWTDEPEDNVLKWKNALLDANILSLRRLFIATEAFLYNCQQFLSCFHETLGCRCKVLDPVPESHASCCPQDDNAAPADEERKDGETKLAKDPDDAQMEAAADYVCSAEEFQAPVESTHRVRSDSCGPVDSERSERMFKSVREAQLALGKVAEELLQDDGNLKKLREDHYEVGFACMFTPEYCESQWKSHCLSMFKATEFFEEILDQSEFDSEMIPQDALAETQQDMKPEFAAGNENTASRFPNPSPDYFYQKFVEKAVQLMRDEKKKHYEDSLEGMREEDCSFEGMNFLRSATLYEAYEGCENVDISMRRFFDEKVEILDKCSETSKPFFQPPLFSKLSTRQIKLMKRKISRGKAKKYIPSSLRVLYKLIEGELTGG